MNDQLRVAFWRTRLLAGSETFIRTQQSALAEKGVTVRAFGFARTPSTLTRDDDVLPYRGYNAGRAALKVFERSRRSRRLEASLRAFDPHVIHAHFTEDAGLVMPTARRLGIPLVVSAYGSDVTRAPGTSGMSRRRGEYSRESLEYATTITANSQFLREHAIARGADPAKVRVVHLGVDFSPAADPSPQEATRRGVLFVGRFTEKKGLDDLVAAMALLPPAVRDTTLTIIGDGETRVELEQQAGALGVDARFLGNQSHDSVRAELARTRVLAVPSRTARDGDSEGLPTIILEAAQARVPIVSTWHSGIPEAVTDGITGLLVPERDPAALAAALGEILSDDERARRYGAAGREHVHAQFDISSCADQLVSIYQDASQGRAR